MSATLLDGYDGVLLDLDGTLYRGSEPIPGAPEVVWALPVPCAFVTNNASRSPAEVAADLTGLGFPARPEQVVTSAQAAAALLADRLTGERTDQRPGDLPSGGRAGQRPGGRATGGPAGRGPVLVVGTESLAAEMSAVGLASTRSNDDGPAAVVQGHSPDTCWPVLAEACLAIRGGALWVACNLDPTLPTERGELPGNGSMVAALRSATGQRPLVAGKPERRLMDEAAARIGARRPLVVGDRLDTDIAGANAAGMDALLVLTGAATPTDPHAAPPHQHPRYIADDVTALLHPRRVRRFG